MLKNYYSFPSINNVIKLIDKNIIAVPEESHKAIRTVLRNQQKNNWKNKSYCNKSNSEIVKFDIGENINLEYLKNNINNSKIIIKVKESGFKDFLKLLKVDEKTKIVLNNIYQFKKVKNNNINYFTYKYTYIITFNIKFSNAECKLKNIQVKKEMQVEEEELNGYVFGDFITNIYDNMYKKSYIDDVINATKGNKSFYYSNLCQEIPIDSFFSNKNSKYDFIVNINNGNIEVESFHLEDLQEKYKEVINLNEYFLDESFEDVINIINMIEI